jgi:lysophospholipase L1-like esterase
MSRAFVIIGDSQAGGLEPHLVSLIGARGRVFSGSVTHDGWSVSRTVSSGEVAELVSRKHPALVLVIFGGGNDSPGDAYVRAMQTLVEQIRMGGNPHILWIGSSYSSRPDTQQRKEAIAQIQHQLAPSLAIEWLDGMSLTRDLAHAPDGIHFVRAAYAEWAQRIDAYFASRDRTTPWFLSLASYASGGLSDVLARVFS